MADPRRPVQGDAATRPSVGQLIGYLLIALGILIAFQPGGIVAGIWLALIGWFLSSAAEQASAQTGIERTLRGVRVRDVMETEPPSVSPNESVASLVQRPHAARRAPDLPRPPPDGGLAGIVTLSDVRRVPRDNWDDGPGHRRHDALGRPGHGQPGRRG